MTTTPRSTPLLLALLVAAPAALVAMPPGLASHLANYATNPVEHDEQGSSAEPDFAKTDVLGPHLENCVVRAAGAASCTPDKSLPPPAPGQSDVLAPGCTDDAGRQLDGPCGLWTVGAGIPVGYGNTLVPARTEGTHGMSGPKAPGRFTPTKSTRATFLDARLDARLLPGGPATLDLNEKFKSLGPGADLYDVLGCGGCKPAFTAGIWAWFGDWTDKNGNGVIDEASHPSNGLDCPDDSPGEWCVDAANEFVWRGACLRVGGADNAEAAEKNGYCLRDPMTAVDFLYPGDHPADCNGDAEALGKICDPKEAPLLGVVGFLGKQGGLMCPDKPPSNFNLDIDCTGADTSDPVFDDSVAVHYDEAWTDASGEPQQDARLWARGAGGVTMFYDGNIFVTMLQVTAFGCAASGNDNGVDLTTCKFTDVDRSQSFNPLVGDLVAGTVQPAARTSWLLLRNAVFPIPLPPLPPDGGAPAPVGVDLTIVGHGADLPTLVDPMQLDCDPLAWDGLVATVTCKESLIVLPPEYEWACLNPGVMVVAEATGSGAVQGELSCTGAPTDACTADASTPLCTSAPNTDQGTLPVTCKATLTAPEALGAWSVRCHSPAS